jgi:hypothetical protein
MLRLTQLAILLFLHTSLDVACAHLPNAFFTMVKALGYKLEGLGFESRWGEILNLPNPSGRARPWGLLSL